MLHSTLNAFALFGAFLTGLATLVRPEMPLLLGVAALVYVLREWNALRARKTILLAAAMAGTFLLPLLPWAARNLITLKKVQFISPRYANLPGEYAPVGYFAWTATWLERYRDVYLSVWKIGEEPVNIGDLPSSAFDSAEEKARIEREEFEAQGFVANVERLLAARRREPKRQICLTLGRVARRLSADPEHGPAARVQCTRGHRSR